MQKDKDKDEELERNDSVVLDSDNDISDVSCDTDLSVSTIQLLETFGQQTAPKTSNDSTRRNRIPNKPNISLNLWSFIKNSVGKDLSKIPMPVAFNEPLSMLQRIAENFEYSDLLDKTASCDDPGKKLVYLAAFNISCYSTIKDRTAKPFNPLLGETFEWDRSDDLGWKLMSEQVSHHPPTSAQFCRGSGWQIWQEFGMGSKFRGQYMRIKPVGIARLDTDDGHKYTWNKVNTTVNNIIMGKLWIDIDGECVIKDLSSGWKCSLYYHSYSNTNKDKQRLVTGHVTDPKDTKVWIIRGQWDMFCNAKPVDRKEEEEIWRCNAPLPDSDKFYSFTLFACQLNEPDDTVAPTDSRCRPDQRLMEEGDFDKANTVKKVLEAKQRIRRKEREESGEVYEPVWFKLTLDELVGTNTYCFYKENEYWNAKRSRDWSMCPNIYDLE